MITGKLDTGLETDSPKKTIDLKFTDYSINKFQSDFSKNKKTIKTKITNSGIKGLVFIYLSFLPDLKLINFL